MTVRQSYGQSPCESHVMGLFAPSLLRAWCTPCAPNISQIQWPVGTLPRTKKCDKTSIAMSNLFLLYVLLVSLLLFQGSQLLWREFGSWNY